MRSLLSNIALRFIGACVSVALSFSATGAENDLQVASTAEPSSVPIAKYTTHMAAIELESLHRLQINDVAGLREFLEQKVALDVLALWGAVQVEHTSIENRKSALGLLRLIAIQNEKFPVAAVNADSRVTAILQSAIEDNPAHAELLRRQDWSKPKWTNWVN